MSSTGSKIESDLFASDLPTQLAASLSEEWRGETGGPRMSPELSYGRHAGPAPHTARLAAVVLLLFRRANRWHLPLTERPPTLTRHGGQVSLPGGSVDAGESSRQAALRELSEELGVERGVEVLGHLADCYIFASDFLVTPWVAAVNVEPIWIPHDHEVQGVVELPLDSLLDARCVARMVVERGPLTFHAPCFRVGTTCIWGATSVILGEFAQLIQGFANRGCV